jgi:glycosyltransferase family protein
MGSDLILFDNLTFTKKISFKAAYFFNFSKYEILRITRYLKNKNPHIASIDQTIDSISNKRKSLCRYGDGEIRLMNNESIEFQKADANLSAKLRQIIRARDKEVLVCLPEVFSGLKSYTATASYFWRMHINNYGKLWMDLICLDKKYYNSFISRPYIIYNDKSKSGNIFSKIKKIWYKKDVVIIEGEKSRLGMGNDLFSEAKSLKRIICPSRNAFSVYNEILLSIQSVCKTSLLLVSLGPTATALAYDLHKLGYQALDVGHIDIEYEWFLRNAVSKIKIPTKYTNEVEGGDCPETVEDAEYESQIIKKIMNN